MKHCSTLRTAIPIAVALACLAAPGLDAATWKAGVGRVDITPSEPIWLAGYASRKAPSTGVAGPIEVKALALEDASGQRLLVVTTDLLSMPRSLAEPVAARLGALYGLARPRILLAASHSHSAPVIRDALVGMYFLDGAELAKVERFTATVEEAMLKAARQAMDRLEPADVAHASGTADFARNRRRVNPDDPSDHDVPIVRVRFRGGSGMERQAVLFAYACHNTTLSGQDVCGDYAGFAQQELERRVPGLTALFASGCGGDQNPDPRGTLDLARQHGATLAAAVAGLLSRPMTPLAPSSRAAFGWTDLPLVPAPSRAELETQARSDNAYVRRRAERLVATLDSGAAIPETYAYAAQVWLLGEDLFIASLAGEVVVDFALRLKRELPLARSSNGRAMVIAYAHDCPGYMPSERVLREGGYEGGGAMLYYGLHGPWASGVEERIVAHVLALARDTARPGPTAALGAALVPVWSEGRFTEGPAWGPDGALYWSDIPNERILRLKAGNTSSFRAPSGKANGLAFDARGRLVACEGADGGQRRVTRTEPGGAIAVLADRIGGKRLNSPNDLTIAADGTIYFSDPRYAGDEPRELSAEAVYAIDPAGVVKPVLEHLVRPNGLAVSPDDRVLYVSDAGAKRLLAYRREAGGGLAGERVVFDFAPGRGIDGMEVDVAGNVYGAAGDGALSGVYVISPAGTLLDFIATPQTATNCAFGENGTTLFVTAGNSLYRIRLTHRGHGVGQQRF